MEKINLAIFLSGQGSNAKNILAYFKNSPKVNCSVIVTNNLNWTINKNEYPDLSVIYLSNKQDLAKNLPALIQQNIQFIVLAGFLWKIPPAFIQQFPNKIINIHPSLLPKYGGKGMHGLHVHEAVLANKEAESGITIHYVNEQYDEGAIIFQYKVPVSENDTASSLQEKIKLEEYKHYPKVIESLLPIHS